MASPINFNQFLEKEKLKSNGSNFTDWFRHVRIFLNGGNLQYVLDAPLGDPPAETETDEVKNVYATRKTRYSQVRCAILCSLEADLQKRFEHHDPHELINELKTIFETHAAVECYEASKHFFSCMMEEGISVSEHMLAMTGHAKKLSDLGIVIPNRLGINRVLQSLPPSYKNFVMNYNMQNMNKELPELFAMLKSAEIEIKKEHQVLMVNKTTSFKKQGKSKGKNKKSGKKAATPPVKPKNGPKPDAECYYCKEKGHRKRNCSKYLADLKSGLVKKKKEASRGGYRYVLTFTDDLSRYGYIYLMKHKSETFEKFKEFQSEVENQRNKKIKFLRSDRGGEYLSYEFGMHLKKCGILSQLTPPGTPQRNGVSERRNRTLLDMVRSMMSLTDLPLSFWSYALETAAFTLNRAPSKSVETTPYELWFNKKPKLSFLKVWGCEAYVKKSEGKIFVAKNGTFLEKEFLTKEVTGRKVELDEIEESLLVDQSSAVPEDVPVPPTPATEEANDNDHETSNEITTEPRRSTRERATPDWYDPCLNVMIVDNNDEDPATYEEAMMSPDSNKWQEAMKSEMGSMYDNKVWTLVDLPDSRKAVENKWIFKRKTDADGLNFSSRNLLDSAAGGTFMSITLGAATKLLDDMMINYSEWHTERTPQGKKVNSVEETSSLGDKIDAIMSMLANGRSHIDPNNVPLASLVAQEENVDVNFIKSNNSNNNAYRNNYGNNNFRPYPSNNGNGYGNSYGNSYNNNKSVPSGLEVMLKEFISTQTAFNKTVEEKLGKIDILASKVDSLALDVDLLKLKVMPEKVEDARFAKTNAIQVRINDNIRLLAELHARWDREEKEKLAKENNVAKVWTITTTSNVNSSHVAAPPTINGKIIGVGNVSTPSAKLPETAETAVCDKTAEIFQNIGDNDSIAVEHNGLDFDDCHITEVIKFLQKLAKSPNASAINLAFTKHITNALIKAREEKLKLEASIPRKLEDGWEPIIKMKFNDFECNALCDLGASISVMPKKIYDMLDLPPLKNCYLDVNLADNVKKKPLGRIDNVRITVNNNLVPVDFVVLDIECNASCPIVLGRPFLRTVGAVIDMKEGNIRYQFPLKKGMEHFPRKRMKLTFDSIIRTSYDVDAPSLDVT
ncbi:hypothetical protein QYE76_060319 [Lolium multiflorum]|uniref:Gag-pol polyprotein n=1 Tax=Lolium multiflorum TaxID=4521 RepID=A0AAD8W654_LOLMU|nr:hypothetical protein QYE76_060319 [Lolium multiflorum]